MRRAVEGQSKRRDLKKEVEDVVPRGTEEQEQEQMVLLLDETKV